jgi:hypothetical protein
MRRAVLVQHLVTSCLAAPESPAVREIGPRLRDQVAREAALIKIRLEKEEKKAKDEQAKRLGLSTPAKGEFAKLLDDTAPSAVLKEDWVMGDDAPVEEECTQPLEDATPPQACRGRGVANE